MNRPRHTKSDDSQPGARADLIDLSYTCIDVHDLPGKSAVPGENPLDEFVKHPTLQVWVQVEWKTFDGRKLFTPNEQRYFESQGIWEFVCSGMLEPLAQWRQHGVPIVVAWEARQIVELFDGMARHANLARQRANAGT